MRVVVNWYKIVPIMPVPTERPSSAKRDKVYICERCNAMIAAPIRGKYGFPKCDLGHNLIERRSFFDRFPVGVVVGVCAYLSRFVFGGGLYPSSVLGQIIFLGPPIIGFTSVIGCIRLARKPLPQKELMPGQLGTGVGILAGFIITFLLDIARLRFLR